MATREHGNPASGDEGTLHLHLVCQGPAGACQQRLRKASRKKVAGAWGRTQQLPVKGVKAPPCALCGSGAWGALLRAGGDGLSRSSPGAGSRDGGSGAVGWLRAGGPVTG